MPPIQGFSADLCVGGSRERRFSGIKKNQNTELCFFLKKNALNPALVMVMMCCEFDDSLRLKLNFKI